MITLESERKACLNRLRVLKKLKPVEDTIYFYEDSLFLKEDLPHQETLHRFRELFGAYKLTSYYMSPTGSLAVIYSFPNLNLIMFFSNAEEKLAEISGGRCRIITETEIKTHHTGTIVCEMEDNEN